VRHYVFKRRWKRALARVVDALGAPLAPRRRAVPAGTRNLLIVRLDHIGDVVCLLPFLDALAGLSPKLRVTTLTRTAGAILLRDTPGVDERLVFDAPWFGRGERTATGFGHLARLVRGRGFEVSLEMTGDARHHLALALAGVPFRAGYSVTGGAFLLHRELPWDATMHAADRNMAFMPLLGAPARTGDVPHLTWRSRDSELAWLAGLGNGRRLILHVDAGTPARRWPADRFAALARDARRAGLTPVFVGLDPALSKAVQGTGGTDLIGRTSFEQLVTLIQASEGVVSADSGPAHIAAALGKPVLVLWSGTADPAIWRPRGKAVRWVEVPVPCAYCGQIRCPLPRHACMEDLTIERVRPAFEHLLAAARG